MLPILEGPRSSTPQKKVDLLASSALWTNRSGSPGKGSDWRVDCKSPWLFDGGALRDGDEIDIWKRNYIGLVVQYAAVGMVFGTLPGTIYPFLFNYLNMEGTQVVSATVLINMPWSFKLFFGMITDCVPIRGYRRRPFMVIGWTLCFAMLLLLGCMDAGAPYYPDNKYATMEKEELTPEIVATFNESAHHMRSMYQIIAYKFLAGILENFSVTCTDPMQRYWAQVTPLNQKIMTIVGNGIFAVTLYCTAKFGLQWSWRKMHAITIVSVTVMDLIVNMLTTWDVVRNQWFWLGVPVAEALPNGIAFVIATFVMVELAGEGNEGAVYGLVGSISNIAIPLASTFTKNVGSNFDLTNADIVEDSTHVRWEVTYVLIIRYSMNLAGLLFLPLLPRQKAETQQLKLNGGYSRILGMFIMPIELWDEHLIPFLTLNEAVALAELSRFFYDVVHEHVQLRAEASLVCTVPELLRVLSKWQNLRDVAFQPVGDPKSGRLHENIHYNVDAAGGLIVDLERNQPAPEPEPVQANESYTDEEGVSVPTRYTCPKVLQNCIRSSDAQVKQLNLSGIVRVSLFDGVNHLQELGLSGCSQIDGLHWLKGIREVDLSYCSFLEDVAFLSDSQHVDLSYCHTVTDLTPLAKCTSVQLNVCRGVSDVCPLRHVRRVSLRNCPEISDVSALGNVHELNLGGCANVMNVSALGNVYELNLSGCINVTDVSALGNVHTLKLRKCAGIVDVSALGGVQDLDLTGCINVTDVHTIITYRCEKLEDIQVLTESAEYLTKVNLSGCSHISDIRFLSGARDVDLRFCDALEDVRPLAGSARIVKLAGCSKLADVSPLARVREVDLSYCNRIEDVSVLESVHTLSLRHCPNVRDVSALSKVHTLNLSGCTQLEDVSALKNVHELNLSDCDKVKDVSMLTGVRVLDLRYNKNNSKALEAGVAKLRDRVPIIRM
ncbi:hypothetical protein JG688_00003761 [Phytophthora aleatoria]|uniref:Folate-Biopterin Transporter (FBT) family n=1 Tax=Phytophthora aleatoria TaxID=2496075 RepID=A0A8J5JA54_9STRA|nr:hypothetical protein JG688_00003761 [Phytophthora aleatoria]